MAKLLPSSTIFLHPTTPSSPARGRVPIALTLRKGELSCHALIRLFRNASNLCILVCRVRTSHRSPGTVLEGKARVARECRDASPPGHRILKAEAAEDHRLACAAGCHRRHCLACTKEPETLTICWLFSHKESSTRCPTTAQTVSKTANNTFSLLHRRSRANREQHLFTTAQTVSNLPRTTPIHYSTDMPQTVSEAQARLCERRNCLRRVAMLSRECLEVNSVFPSGH